MNTTLNNSTTEIKQASLKHYLMVLTLCLVAVISFVGHFVILLLTHVNKTLRKKPYIVSILLLSSSDILLSAAMFLFSLIFLVPLRQTWICGFTFFLMQLGFVTSLVHTLTICTERYLHTRTIPMEAFSVRKRHMLTLINMGMSSLILVIPYLFTVREPTINSCILINIYGDNVPYALLPTRSITFLIWISTIVLYSLTTKNFRNAGRRTGCLDGVRFTQNTFPKAAKAATNNQPISHASFPSCSNTGLSSIKEGHDSFTEKNKQNKNSKHKIRNAAPNNFEDNQVTNSGQSKDTLQAVRVESKIQTNDKTVNHAANVHVMTEAQGVNKNREDTILNHENPLIRRNMFRPLPDPSTTVPSSSRSGSVKRQENSNVHSSVRTKAFRIVSVVFVVFLVTMTPQALVGLIRIGFPMTDVVVFGCSILAVSSVITNPFMYVFLLKDFRKVIMRCQGSQ